MPVYEPNYKRLDRGPADYDHRNVLTVSYVYKLPKLNGGNAALRYAVNGWQPNGIYSFRSGDPLTITGAGNSGTGLGRERSIWNGKNPYGPTTCTGVTSACKPFLKKANFSTKPLYTVNTPPSYGNVVKGSFTGLQYNDWHVSLMRLFPIYESTKFEFRAEYFNILNHTNLGDPVQAVTSSSFGRITSAQDPRIGKLGVKLLF